MDLVAQLEAVLGGDGLTSDGQPVELQTPFCEHLLLEGFMKRAEPRRSKGTAVRIFLPAPAVQVDQHFAAGRQRFLVDGTMKHRGALGPGVEAAERAIEKVPSFLVAALQKRLPRRGQR